MRILYCTFSYPPELSGQAVFTHQLAQGLADRGHEVRVLVSAFSEHATTTSDARIQIIRPPAVNLPGTKQKIHLPLFSRALMDSCFNDFQPDIIHVQDPLPIHHWVIREARQRGIPVIITQHTGPEITAPYVCPKNSALKNILHSMMWVFLRWHLNQADLVTVPSNFSKQMLLQRGIRPDIRVIHCGIQLEQFHPQPNLDSKAVRQQLGLHADKTLFVYVGRLDIEKNLDTLIHAMAQVNREDIELAIIGQGTERARLQALSEKLGISKQVVFTSAIEHAALPKLLNAADAFVMPGNAESFSIATLEAMACAKPVLAARAAALPELVTHDWNGYLFEPHDPQEGAQGLAKLADEPENRKRMGNNGLARANRYHLSRMVSSYEDTYLQTHQTEKQRSTLIPRQPAISQRHTARAKKTGVVLRHRLLGLLAIFLTLLLSGALYDQAQARPYMQAGDLTPMSFAAGQNLLVIAPHPDDEILASGGLIQHALEADGQVLVVIVTNGDGQSLSPTLMQPLSIPKESGDVDFGQRRQNENMAAMEEIGVDLHNVIFLGYRGGVFGGLWDSGQLNLQPSTLPYPRASGSPYQNTYNPQSASRGNDVINDLLLILLDFHPNIVVVPKSEDARPNHAAVSDFTHFTIAAYDVFDVPIAPEVYTYLVHSAGYPTARSGFYGNVLLPPSALTNQGIGWFTYNLSSDEQKLKKAALDQYTSQICSSTQLLQNFLRANEIFFSLPVIEISLPGCKGDDILENYAQIEPVFSEPVREDFKRLMFSHADLVSWRMVRLGDFICFGAETRLPASEHYQYRILAKLPDGSSLTIAQPDDLVWFADEHFGACFNLEELGSPPIMGFSAETWRNSLLVDRTAWRFVYFTEPEF